MCHLVLFIMRKRELSELMYVVDNAKLFKPKVKLLDLSQIERLQGFPSSSLG